MAARGSQSNTMLYSLITFVGLFVVATVFAVVFYVKSEEYRTQLETLRSDMDQIATSRERGMMGRIVGRTERGESYVGTMQTLIHQLYTAITGQEPGEEMPADVIVNDAVMQINQTLEQLGPDASPAVGQDGVALLNTISDLRQRLDGRRSRLEQLERSFYALQDDFDELRGQMQERQNIFLEELEISQALTNEIRDQFETLRQQMESATDAQIQTYQERLQEEQDRLQARQQELQNLENRLDETESLLQDAMAQLEAIKPRPDMEVTAFRPDARIVRLDLQNELVTLDVGARDHVYPGLTFSLYESNVPIPEDGRGKAEIEVFQIGEHVSVARIVRWDRRNPIVQEDLVVNMIWDPQKSNRFVVIGDFDTTRDGRIDPDGKQQVTDLIERWGGRVQDNITIDTDFVIVGVEPDVPPRPTQAELDADPTALQRYESAVQRTQRYSDVLTRAGKLGVPVFNYERFLHLIGYDTLSTKLGI